MSPPTETAWPSLSSLEPTLTQLLNPLVFQRRILELTGHGETHRFGFTELNEPPSAQYWGLFSWAGGNLWIGGMDKDWRHLVPFLAKSDMKDVEEACLPKELENALAELALEGFVKVLESWTRSVIQFKSIHTELPSSKNRFCLQMEVHSSKSSAFTTLSLNRRQLTKLSKQASQQPLSTNPTLPPTTFVGTITLGSVLVSITELRSLQAADVLVLDMSAQLPLKTLILQVSGHRFQLKLLSAGPDPKLRIMDELPSDETDETMDAEAEGEALIPRVDDLEATVSVELGHINLTVAELQALSVGYVLEGTGLDHRRVALRVNGQLVGHGELVDLGDRLGVRITRFSGHE